MLPSTNAVDAGCYLRLLANWGLGLAGVPLVIASEADEGSDADPGVDPLPGARAGSGAASGRVAGASTGPGLR
ncbi:MAG: hypothetical protein Q8Q73_11530 [Stagnimonas sp.]|nr:hypothetical protein [Stagnimonas sp.]